VEAERLDATAYLAPRGFAEHLLAELKGVEARYERLIVARGGPQGAFWAQNVWKEPCLLRFGSIGEAAKHLRGIQRNWALYSYRLHRRSLLLKEALPFVSEKPRPFPYDPPPAPMGACCLIDEHTMLYSPACSSPFPGGAIECVEDKEGPPSRAYLKLYEALSLLGRRPGPGARCLDAGSSPGGWTWVLAGLGARVLAVARAPLEPRVAAMPGVEWRKGNAFSVLPGKDGPFDWIFSDVICYPRALYEWVQAWLDSGSGAAFVCTIKMQGAPDMETTRAFAAIPGSRVAHLHHNKHELTWMLARGDEGLR